MHSFWYIIKCFFDGTIIYRLNSSFVRLFNRLLKKRPPSDPFLSGDTFRSMATIKFEPFSFAIPFSSSRVEVIYSSTYNLDRLSSLLKLVNYKHVVILHHSDLSFTPDLFNQINSRLLLHCFAQNSSFVHTKVTTIPIGLEDSWRHKHGIVRDFLNLSHLKNTPSKIPRILYGFSVGTNFEARSTALNYLKCHPLADQFKSNSGMYRRVLTSYMFVASPPGNGLDCHRTWEALYLGVIPIVIGHSFYSQFPNFPGLVLNHWSELDDLTSNDLISIYHQKSTLLSNYFDLWSATWRHRIFQLCY